MWDLIFTHLIKDGAWFRAISNVSELRSGRKKCHVMWQREWITNFLMQHRKCLTQSIMKSLITREHISETRSEINCEPISWLIGFMLISFVWILILNYWRDAHAPGYLCCRVLASSQWEDLQHSTNEKIYMKTNVTVLTVKIIFSSSSTWYKWTIQNVTKTDILINYNGKKCWFNVLVSWASCQINKILRCKNHWHH